MCALIAMHTQYNNQVVTGRCDIRWIWNKKPSWVIGKRGRLVGIVDFL